MLPRDTLPPDMRPQFPIPGMVPRPAMGPGGITWSRE